MLLMSRSKLTSKRMNKSTTNSLNSCNSILSNPEIGALVGKLNQMTGNFPDNWSNPLNLVDWGRTKYHPTESQNRIRIENQISLKKASRHKVRPNVKSRPQTSKSVELTRQPEMSYKKKYTKMREQYELMGKFDEIDSEQDHPIEVVRPKFQQFEEGKFKFYQKVRKYKRVAFYIESRIVTKKDVDSQKRQRMSLYSQKSFMLSQLKEKSPMKKGDHLYETLALGNQDSKLKIDSIVKKWKPVSKIEKRFAQTELKPRQKRRYSLKGVKKVIDLPLETPRSDSISRQTASPDRFEVGKF